MEKKRCPFKVGDNVIFDPNEDTIGHHQHTFERLGAYPGKILIIKEIKKEFQGEFIILKNGDGFLCENFRGYIEGEKCPFHVDDIIRFTPTEITKKRFPMRLIYRKPKPGTTGQVKKIVNDIWVHVDDDIHGFYWKDFTLIKKSDDKTTT